MPTVPISPVSRIQEVGLPTPTLTAKAPAVPDLLGAAGQVSKVILEQKERADVAAVSEAQSNARRAANRLMFDPDEGFTNLKGKNAFENLEEYRDRYNREVEGIRSTLKGANQQKAFSQWMDNYLPSYEKDLLRHGSSQNRAYEEAQSAASIETIGEDIINHRYDPERVRQGFDELGRALDARASLDGLDGDAKREFIENGYSLQHAQVIKTMLANPGETDLARAYFDANKKQMESSERTEVLKLLDAKEVDVKAQSLADQARLKFGDDLQAQDRWLKKQAGNNIDLLDASRKRVDFENTIAKKGEVEREDDTVNSVYNELHRNGGQLTPEMERQIQSLPAADQSRIRLEAVGIASGKYVPGNEQKFEGLVTEFLDDPNNFYKQDRDLQLHDLSKAQRDEVMEMRLKSREGVDPDIDKPIFKYLQTHGSIIDDALKFLKLDKKSTGDQEEINNTRRLIRESFDRFVTKNGREPEESEFREKVVGPVLKTIRTTGAIYGTNDTRVGNLQLGDEVVLNVEGYSNTFVITDKLSDIPEDHSRRILEALTKETGRPASSFSEAEIVARYRFEVDELVRVQAQ